MPLARLQLAALVSGFLAALAAPLADQLLRPDSAREPSVELRRAAESPAFPEDLASACAFPAQFEAHHLDVFGLRDRLLRLRGIVCWYGLGLSPSPLVVRGAEDWTYTTVDGSRDVWRGTSPMAEEELEVWADALRARRDWLASQGADYMYVVAPNKESVYPEHLPPSWRRITPGAPTRLDQLVSALRHEDGLLLDLRSDLIEARGADTPGDELYTRLGTHWNGNGAATAFSSIARRLRLLHPELPMVDVAGLERVYSPGGGDGWGPRMYLDEVLEQREWMPKPPAHPLCELNLLSLAPRRAMTSRHAGAASAPRLLVFHDSFGPYVQPLLSKFMPATLFIQMSRFDPDLVRAYKPDVVLDLYVERVFVRTSHLENIPYGTPAGRVPLSGSASLAWQGANTDQGAAFEIPTLRLDPALDWEIYLEGEAGLHATVEVYPLGHGPGASRVGKQGFAARGKFAYAMPLDPLDGELRPLARALGAGTARIEYAEIRRR